MNANVDNRVVEMRFDNAQFEKGVKQSMESLDKLEESLKLEDAGKGIEEVAGRFNILQEMAIGAARKIGEAFTDMGLKMAKSLTIDQISAGFGKYEQELRAAQTIMNATGESIETVNSELARLMWYTDETSYSYGNMVDNISKFTAQGIKLKDANDAMQGIANMAGLVGATVTDASHAMDGFSKAMAAGSMKLQNWKWIQTAHMETVQTKEAFIDAAIECGTLQRGLDGIARTYKGTEVSASSFTETLKDQWLTSDVMMKTFTQMASYSSTVHEFQTAYEELTGEYLQCAEAMEMLEDSGNKLELSEEQQAKKVQAYIIARQKATGELINEQRALTELANIADSVAAQAFKASQQYRTFQDAVDATADAVSSAWKKIFASVFGDAKQAVQLWTEVGNAFYYMFGEPLEIVTDAFAKWNAEGGWDKFFVALQNTITGITRLVDPFRQAFNIVFGLIDTEGSSALDVLANALTTVANRLKIFTEAMQLSEGASEGLANILSVLLKPLRWVADALDFTVKVGASLLIIVQFLINAFLEMFSASDNLGEGLKKIFGEENYTKLLDAWSNMTASLAKAWDNLKKSISNAFKVFVENGAATSVLETITKLSTTLMNIVTIGLTSIMNLISKIDLSPIVNSLSSLLDGSKSFTEIGSNIVNGIIQGITSTVSTLWDTISGLASGIITTIKDVLQIQSPSVVMIGIGAFLVLGLIKGIESQIPKLKFSLSDAITNVITNAIASIGTTLSKLKEAINLSGIGSTLLSGLQSLMNFLANGVGIVKNFFKEIEIGKLILEAFAGALGVLSLKIVNSFANVINGAAKILSGIGSIFKNVGGAIKDFGKSMRAWGRAKEIESLSSALKSLAIAVGVITASMIALTFVADNPNFEKVLLVLGGVMAALLAYQAVVELIARINAPTEALGPIDSLMDSISGLISSFKRSKLMDFAISMALLGTAFLSIGATFKLISTVEDPGLAIGVLVGIGAFFAVMAALMHDVDGKWSLGKASGSFGTSMLKIAVALNLMMLPIFALKDLEWNDLQNGVLFIGGFVVFIGALVGVFAAVKNLHKNIDSFASAMIKLAVAMDLMLAPFIIFQQFPQSWDTVALAVGFIGLVAGFFYGVAKLFDMTKAMATNLDQFSVAMIKLAAAMDLMMLPFIIFQQFPQSWETIIEAVGFMGLYAGFLYGILELFHMTKPMVSNLDTFSTAMIKLAVAMDLMVLPVIAIAALNAQWPQILQGITTVAAMALLIAGFMALTSILDVGALQSVGAGAGMILMAGAVAILAGVVAALAGMKDLEAAKKAVGLLLEIMVPFMVVLGLMGTIGAGVLAAGAGLAVAAVGLIAVAGALLMFQDIDPTKLNAVLEIFTADKAGDILLWGAAAVVLGAGGLVMAAAVAAIGAAVLLALPSITAFIDTLSSFLVVIDNLGDISKEKVANITSLFTAIAALIPTFLANIGKGIVDLAKAIADGAVHIIAAVKTIITGIVQAFVESSTEIANGLAQVMQTIGPIILDLLNMLLTNLADLINTKVPELLDKLLSVVVEKVEELINFVTDKIPTFLTNMANAIVDSVSTLLINLQTTIPQLIALVDNAIHSIIDTIVANVPYFVEAGFKIISGLIIGISEGLVLLVNAAFEALIIFIEGLSTAIDEKGPELKTACNKLTDSIFRFLTEDTIIGKAVSAGKMIIDGFKQALSAGDAYDEGAALGQSAIDGLLGPEGIADPNEVSDKAVAGGEMVVDGFVKPLTATESRYKAKQAGAELGAAGAEAVADGVDVSKMKDDVGDKFDAGIKGAADGVKSGDIISIIQKVGDFLGLQLPAGMDIDKIANSISGIWGTSILKAENQVKSIYEGASKSAAPWMYPDEQKEKIPGGSGGGSATKSTQKSIEELAKTYHYGEEAIKSFTNMYGKSIQTMDETADVSKIATQAVDTLAVKLYTLSEDYQKDLNNASINTETVLQHIQASFNEVYDGITNSLKNVDLFSEFEESEDWDISEKIDDARSHLESMEDYVSNAQIFAKMENIPDQLKKAFLAAGYQSKEALKMFVEADEEEVDELVSIWQEATNLATTAGGDVMGAWAGQLIDIENVVQGSVLDTGAMFAAGFANAIPADAANTQATQMALNAVQAMRDALGIASPSKVTEEIGTNFCLGMYNKIEDWKEPMHIKAEMLGRRLTDGLRDSILQAQPTLFQDFYSLGVNIIEGLAQGIEANRSRAINAAVQVAVDAYEAACAELDVESPSKKFMWIGKMVDEGFAEGIIDNSSTTTDAAHKMAEEVYNVVSEDLSNEYSIRPILDLSDVRAKAGSIGSMLEGQRVAAFGIQNGSGLPQNGASYNFVQNNYSPKALSRIDIYRQTKNQFSMLKGV